MNCFKDNTRPNQTIMFHKLSPQIQDLQTVFDQKIKRQNKDRMFNPNFKIKTRRNLLNSKRISK